MARTPLGGGWGSAVISAYVTSPAQQAAMSACSQPSARKCTQGCSTIAHKPLTFGELRHLTTGLNRTLCFHQEGSAWRSTACHGAPPMLLQTADNPRLLRGFGEDVTSVLHGAALRGEDADIRPLFRPRSHSALTPCLAAAAASAI